MMSLNRALFCVAIGTYFAVAVPDRAVAALIVTSFGLLATAAVFVHVLLGPARSAKRQVAAMLADMAVTGTLMHLGDERMSGWYPLILWMILGNGFRLGRANLLRATAVGAVGFAAVVVTTPFWRENVTLSVGLLAGLVTLPLYTMALLTRLNAAKRQAEAASQAKSLFLANVSHELRTPLHAIIGTGSLLEQASLGPEPAEMVQTIMGASRSLLELIDDVLKLSKAEADDVPRTGVEFDVPSLLNDVRSLIQVQAREKGLRIAVHVGFGTPRRVKGDERHIREVLVNLAGNALKFTEHGGVLVAVGVAGASLSERRLRFEVADTGIGVAPEAQERIFEKFMQADRSITERFGGTGLGLAICKRLVAALGGSIGVESRLGEGSTFWFEVNCVAAQPSVAEAGIMHGDGSLTALSIDAGVQPAVREAVRAWGPDVLLVECGGAAIQAQLGAASAAGRGVLIDGTTSPASAEAIDAAVRSMRATDVPPLVLVGDPRGAGPGRDLRWIAPTWVPGDVDKENLRAALAIAEGLRGALAPVTAAGTELDLPARDHPVVRPQPARCLSILVVDDNRTNQKVVAKIIESGGHDCQVVSDGEAALDAMEGGSFDLVLMDVNMPTLDGIETTKLYRVASLGMPRLPILGLTADASPEMSQRCRDAGMDGCITKPIKAAPLLDAIESAVPDVATPARPRVAKASPPLLRVVQVPVLDAQLLDGLREVGGDAFVSELLSGFLADARELLPELESALGLGDTSKFQAEAHALGSSAANVGAVRVSQLSLSLERMRSGEISLHGRKKLRELKEEVENFAAACALGAERRSQA